MADVDDDQPPERDDVTPDELCDELSNDFGKLEMTEDETEFLLQEALALNKRLKSELRRKTNPDVASSLESALSGSPLASKPPRHGRRGGRTQLPPINHGATSTGKKTSKVKKLASDRATHSAGSANRKPSASKGRPRGSRSADNRPEWNERFSV